MSPSPLWEGPGDRGALGFPLKPFALTVDGRVEKGFGFYDSNSQQGPRHGSSYNILNSFPHIRSHGAWRAARLCVRAADTHHCGKQL